MILTLRALGVGDLVTAVPALRGLMAAFPDESHALAAPSWLTPLIDLIGGVGRILPTDGLGQPRWTVEPPRLAVNLHGSGPESHRLLAATGPKELWAFANTEADHRDGPMWTDDEHEVHRWCRLLGYYGVNCDETDRSLAVPPMPAPAGATIVHPGAKFALRRWPAERFAAVARRSAAAGHRVLITGSAGERDLCVRVAELAGLPPSAVPATGLAELAALVAAARVVISGDTGVAHLATAYRTPSVTLFGPMSPRRWGPPDRPYHRPIWHGTRSERGDRPGADVHPALLAIGEDEVLAAVEAVTGAAAATVADLAHPTGP